MRQRTQTPTSCSTSSPEKPNAPASVRSDPMDAFAAELRNVVESVRNNQESKILNGRLAEDAVKICDMEAASIAASCISG